MKEKTVWVVHYEKLADFVAKTKAVGATGVAIRTDNDIDAAVKAFHVAGIKVYGWRWPSAKRDSAIAEARRVAELLRQDLDGYFVDPEGAPGRSYDWDLLGLDGLASDFCDVIKAAAPAKPLGVTSHYRAKKIFPKLPWAAFFQKADLLLPQAYWRVDGGIVGHGIPEDNYRKSIEDWVASGGDKRKIVPIAGELSLVNAPEIKAYASEARLQKVEALHFYTYTENVSSAVWTAIAKA